MIIPTDFVGEFQVFPDANNGIDFVHHNGKLMVNIPDNGRLSLKNADVLLSWHQLEIQTETGGSIKIYNSGYAIGQDERAIRAAGIRADGSQFWFVGNDEQYQVWLAKD